MIARTTTDTAKPGGIHTIWREGSSERVISALVISTIVLFLASITALAVVMVFGRPAVAGGPMWSMWSMSRLSPCTVNALEDSGVFFGGLATAAGIAAVGHGWRPSARFLLGAGAAAAALFVFLPPVRGDTDVLNYAIYGRILAIGHNPYVMTPAQLHRTGDPVGLLAPAAPWETWPTVYGPVATAMQWTAAELGGASMAWIVFWIKLGNGIAYVATGAGLAWLAGGDRARQARTCLLWAASPLMLFWLVGGGHVDVMLALLVVLALIVIRSSYGSSAIGGAVTGFIVGAAMAIKTPFALAALGLAWAVRKSPQTIVTGLSCAAAVFIGCYLLPGVRNPSIFVSRLTWNASFLHLPVFISSRPALFAATAVLAGLTLAGLLLWRMPPGNPELAAVRPAAALVIAYLVAFPTPGPWYYALIFPLLALLPASRLDYLMIAVCLLLSEAAITQRVHVVYTLGHAGRLLMLALLFVVSVRRTWNAVSPDGAAAAATTVDYSVKGRHRTRR
jgi:hypothetical protein